MSRLLALLLALALLLVLAPRPALAQDGAAPEPLLIAAGQTVAGDVATVDRPILVLGTVEGDVTSWSGPITVEGAVRGDVVSYAGSITLEAGAQVGGSVLAVGGGVKGASSGNVAGVSLGEQPVAGGLLIGAIASILDGSADAAGDLPQPLVAVALGIAALLLSAACALVWPRRTAGVGLALSDAPGRSAALGLLSTVLLALLALPAGALLALSLIGLPLLLPLLLLLQTPFLFGLAGLGRTVAARLPVELPPAAAAAAGALAILIPLVLLGALAPLWSAALFYLVAGVGLGAAILSRFGAYRVAR